MKNVEKKSKDMPLMEGCGSVLYEFRAFSYLKYFVV
jgi:hypothetical protein